MGEMDGGRVEVDAVYRVLIPEVPFVDLVFGEGGLVCLGLCCGVVLTWVWSVGVQRWKSS